MTSSFGVPGMMQMAGELRLRSIPATVSVAYLVQFTYSPLRSILSENCKGLV